MKTALLALCLLAAPSAALADTYTYNFSTGFAENFTYTSSTLLTTDTPLSAGSLDSCSFFLGSCTGVAINAASHSIDFDYLIFGLYLDQDTYTGSATDFTVGNHVESNFTLDITDSDGVSATPEPSSLALLGTGLLGTVGAARRRFTRTA